MNTWTYFTAEARVLWTFQETSNRHQKNPPNIYRSDISAGEITPQEIPEEAVQVNMKCRSVFSCSLEKSVQTFLRLYQWSVALDPVWGCILFIFKTVSHTGAGLSQINVVLLFHLLKLGFVPKSLAASGNVLTSM